MKVKASLKLICPDCYYVRRGKNLFIRCTTSPRHKRRQGFSTLNRLPASEMPALELQSNFSLNVLPLNQGHASCTHCNKVMGPLQLHQVYDIQARFAEHQLEEEELNEEEENDQ